MERFLIQFTASARLAVKCITYTHIHTVILSLVEKHRLQVLFHPQTIKIEMKKDLIIISLPFRTVLRSYFRDCKKISGNNKHRKKFGYYFSQSTKTSKSRKQEKC